MADKKRTKRTADKWTAETIHDRGLPDEEYAASEPERIRDMQRAREQPPHDPDEFVTDAEMEVREADSSPQEDDV